MKTNFENEVKELFKEIREVRKKGALSQEYKPDYNARISSLEKELNVNIPFRTHDFYGKLEGLRSMAIAASPLTFGAMMFGGFKAALAMFLVQLPFLFMIGDYPDSNEKINGYEMTALDKAKTMDEFLYF